MKNALSYEGKNGMQDETKPYPVEKKGKKKKKKNILPWHGELLSQFTTRSDGWQQVRNKGTEAEFHSEIKGNVSEGNENGGLGEPKI